jgi:predicted TIM-barrel fold metal-dependent hydrolase
MYRMDHAYKRHRFWLETGKLSKLPSEYFSNNIYVTFQDDFAATHLTALSPTKRLMWASDFPHNDGTYPNTREVISKLTDGMSAEDRTRIIGANVTELYGLAS